MSGRMTVWVRVMQQLRHCLGIPYPISGCLRWTISFAAKLAFISTLEKAAVLTQLFEFLQPRWETNMQFLIPGFSQGQPWLLQAGI